MGDTERDQKRGKSERTAHHICKNQLELVGPGRTAVERCGKITGIRNEGPFLNHHITNTLKFTTLYNSISITNENTKTVKIKIWCHCFHAASERPGRFKQNLANFSLSTKLYFLIVFLLSPFSSSAIIDKFMHRRNLITDLGCNVTGLNCYTLCLMF